jgi:hypothetical protein
MNPVRLLCTALVLLAAPLMRKNPAYPGQPASLLIAASAVSKTGSFDRARFSSATSINIDGN